MPVVSRLETGAPFSGILPAAREGQGALQNLTRLCAASAVIPSQAGSVRSTPSSNPVVRGAKVKPD